jgi:flotillin
MNGIPFAGIFAMIAAIVAIIVVFGLLKSILKLRVVVPPTEVHIVQSQSLGRVTYGQLKTPTPVSGGAQGEMRPATGAMQNTYYRWPTWLPRYGVQVSVLPLSIFDLDLKNYEAYDKERVPFTVDVKAFYCIENAALAAERIASIDALKKQLEASLQGAVRKILAEHAIEEIMQGRSVFGQKFTDEVGPDLKAWGVTPVKSIELMDIKDAAGQMVIEAISAKRISGIDKESRVAVAENKRAAQEAEIEASRQVELQEQDKIQKIGLRKAEVAKTTGIAQQEAQQQVAASERKTVESQMEVKREAAERAANIDKSVQVINANRDKEVQTIDAERNKSVAEKNAERDKNVAITNADAGKAVKTTQAQADKEVLIATSEGKKTELTNLAEGNLAIATKEAQGIQAKGEAEGAAATAIALAPVTAQIKLQESIGTNQQYQDFVVRQRVVEKDEKVGIATAEAQGKALASAKIKVLSNVGGGASSLGQQLGSLLEGLNMTDTGNRILTRLGAAPAGGDDDDTTSGVTTDAGGQRIPLKDRVQRPGANGTASK